MVRCRNWNTLINQKCHHSVCKCKMQAHILAFTICCFRYFFIKLHWFFLTTLVITVKWSCCKDILKSDLMVQNGQKVLQHIRLKVWDNEMQNKLTFHRNPHSSWICHPSFYTLFVSLMKAADATEETHCELELVSVKSVYMLRLIPLFLGSICLNLTTFKPITTDLDKKMGQYFCVFFI